MDNMTFPEWLKMQPRGTMTRIQRETGLGYATIHRCGHGSLVKVWATAKAISEATGGAVSIRELCEPSEPIEAVQ